MPGQSFNAWSTFFFRGMILDPRYPRSAVIIMTAHSDMDSAVAAYQGGAFEYLPKPFDVDEAVELARRAISQGTGAKDTR